MSAIGDAIQEKCLAFGDRVIRLNDFLLEQAANRRSEGRSQMEGIRKGKPLTSSVLHHTSRVPVHLMSVAALANQLLRSGTSIGANNAEYSRLQSKVIHSLERGS